MFAGTTTVALALLPEVDAVTPLELEPYLLKWAMPWWEKAGVADKIHARIGDAQKSLKELAKEGQTFDMVRPSRSLR
jgi:caffeoyl-CoA O-methyltransferase